MSQRERFDPDSLAPGAPAMPTLRGESRAPGAHPRPSRARLAGRLLAWTLALVVLSAFAAYALLPAFAKVRAERWLAQELSRPVSIERLRFDPFTLVADLESLRIGKREGEAALLTVASAHIDFAWTSLRRRGPVIERLRINRPVLALERERGGELDVADLLRRWRDPDTDTPDWLGRFSIANIELEEGSIVLDDTAVGQKHRVEALTLRIPFLSSLPVHGTIDIEPSLSAIVNGAPFTAAGQALPFAEDRSSTLTVDIGTSDLLRYVDYLPTTASWRITAGQASARLVMEFRQPVGGDPSLQFSGALAVAGLQLVDDANRPMLSLPGASVELLEYDMQAGRLRIGEVVASAPRLDWRQASDDAPVAGDRESTARALEWSVARIGVVDGRMRVDARLADGTRLRLDASDVQAQVDEVSSDGTMPSRFAVSAAFGAGETLEVEGRFSHEPLLVSGRFDARGARLARWLAPFEERLPLRVASGTLDLSGGFEYGWRDGGQAPLESPEAWPLRLLAWKSRFAGLRLEPQPGGRIPHAQALDSLAADGLALDFVEKRIGFSRAHAEGLALALARGADGVVDLGAFLEALPDGWWIEPGEFSLGTAQVRLDDDSLGADRLQIAEFALGPRGEDGFAAVSFDARLGEVASLRGAGRLAVDPLRLALAVEAEGFALAPWRDRLDAWPGVRIAEGALDARGDLAYEAGTASEPASISWEGAASVTGLRLETSGTGAEVMRAKAMRTERLSLRTRPARIDAGELELEGLRARFEISPDGALDLVAADGTPVLDAPGAGDPGRDALEWRLAGLKLLDARIDIDDLGDAASPPLGLFDLAGTVGAIGPDMASEVALAASLRAGGKISATGRVRMADPLASLELDAVLDEFRLETLSPYARRHLGHPLDGGGLDARLQYRIRDRRLEARHELVLREPVFGERTVDAIGEDLPLELSLALLRDANGVVELSLPVSGSLDDPDFSIAASLAGSFRKYVGEVAARPFERLARLVDGSADRLTQVGFSAGSARLGEQELAGLRMLAAALGQRPGLALRIAGRADSQVDRDALAQHQFERMLKARKVRGQGGSVSNLDGVTIGRGEYPLLVDALFREASLPLPVGRDGRPRDIGVSEKAKALLATVPVGDSQLVDLAQDRAQAVHGWLSGQGGIDPSRLTVDAPAVGRGSGRNPGGRVEFRLLARDALLARSGESS